MNQRKRQPQSTTPKNATPVRSRKEEQQAQQKKKDRRDRFIGALIVYFAALILIGGIVLLCIGCQHRSVGVSGGSDASMTLDDGVDKTHQVKIRDYTYQGMLYIDFTDLALRCDMVISGNNQQQTFTATNNGEKETIVLTVDSKKAVINGQDAGMPGEAVMQDGDIWIPMEFASQSTEGVLISYDKEAGLLTIKRKELNASTKGNPLYEPIRFTYHPSDPLDPITDSGFSSVGTETAPGTEKVTEKATEKATEMQTATTTKETEANTAPVSPLGFKADLSSYEPYMEPKDRDAYLLLVNANHRIGEDYIPQNLTVVYQAAGKADKYKMIYVAAMAYEAMAKEAAANGMTLVAASGYRSYKTQEQLVQSYTNQYMSQYGLSYDEAYAKTLTDTALPGASEHQTGMTMDVNSIYESFGATKLGKWLAENSYKFGFILRYPKDKEEITGIVYEPWHFRYVGRYHATKMYELGMCLEEYTDYLKTH